MEPNKHFVRGVLQAGVRFVKLPRGLGGQLTELVTIRNVGKCPINQIGTHEGIPLIPLTVLARSPTVICHWTPAPQSFVVSLTTYDANLSKKMQKCATHDNGAFYDCSAWNWQLDVGRTPEWPGNNPCSTGSGTRETYVFEMT
jgi:hypothetical protein